MLVVFRRAGGASRTPGAVICFSGVSRNAVTRLRLNPFGADEHGDGDSIRPAQSAGRGMDAEPDCGTGMCRSIRQNHRCRAQWTRRAAEPGEHKAQVVLSSPVLWNVCQRIGPPEWAEQRLSSNTANELQTPLIESLLSRAKMSAPRRQLPPHGHKKGQREAGLC